MSVCARRRRTCPNSASPPPSCPRARGIPEDGGRGEVRPAREAHRGGRRARERPGGDGGGARCSASTGVDPETIDAVVYFGSIVEGLGRVAGVAVDRAPARLRNAFAFEYDNVSHGTPGRAAPRARPARAPSPSCAASCSSARAASRTCSTTATSARASCSTSATAPSRRSSIGEPERQRAARRARDHRRLVLAAGEGGPRRHRRLPDGSPFLDVADPGVDEGAASTRSRCRTSSPPREGALERSGATPRRRRVPLPAAHEAVDVRGAARRSSGSSDARRVPRRHRPHERRRLAVRRSTARPARAGSPPATSCCCSPPGRATRGPRRSCAGGRSHEARRARAGLELGPSSWLEVPQARIDAFADATEDHQSFHVDAEAAARGPYGTTVAHGYLTLSLLPALVFELLPVEATVINYGVDRVRFPAPVPAGIAHPRLGACRPRRAGQRRRAGRDRRHGRARGGGDRPVCVAEMLFRYVHEPWLRRLRVRSLVTGAAGGIGSAIVARLEADGWRGARRRRRRRRPATREGNRAVVDAALERFGRLDAVVANAGFQHVAPVRDFPEERWDALLAVLLTSPFLLAKYAWDALAASGDGRFCAVASAHGARRLAVQVGLRRGEARRARAREDARARGRRGRHHGERDLPRLRAHAARRAADRRPGAATACPRSACSRR